MRLNQFLLLMTLTSIACGSIVASSKGLIQVKTLDAISQRELTDGTRRKLRGSLKKDDVADVEERAPISFEHFAAKFDGMVTKSKRKFKSLFPESVLAAVDNMGTKSKEVAKQINLKFKSLVEKFRNFIAKLKRIKTGEKYFDALSDFDTVQKPKGLKKLEIPTNLYPFANNNAKKVVLVGGENVL